MAGRQNKEARQDPYKSTRGARRPGEPRVGPADAETRRAAMKDHEEGESRTTRKNRARHINKRSQDEGRANRDEKPTSDLSAQTAGRRLGGRARQIEEALEDAL